MVTISSHKPPAHKCSPASCHVSLRSANLQNRLMATWTQVSGIDHKGVTHRETGNSLTHILGLPGKGSRNQRGKTRSKWWVANLIVRVEVTAQSGLQGEPCALGQQAEAAGTPLPAWRSRCICTCAHSNTSPCAPCSTVCRALSLQGFPLIPSHLSQHRQAGQALSSPILQLKGSSFIQNHTAGQA